MALQPEKAVGPNDGEQRAGAGMPTAATSPVSPRAWLLGIVLIPLLVFWVEYTEIVANGPDLAAMSMPMSAVFALMVLVVVNVAVKRLAPRLALSQAELMSIYCMNTIAVYVSGIGMMQFLHPTLVGWFYYAKPENRWDQWFPYIRDWAVPDRSVIADYYAGRSSLFTPEHLAAWIRPIAVWSAFIFVLLYCMYCIATLIRKQWVDNERLVFPIVQIPLEITRDGGATPLWRNRLLWLGVGIPVVLESIAAIHFTIAPSVPYLPIKPEPSLEIGQYFTIFPWTSIGYTTLSFYPLVIGLTYLLSLDVSFSCWFFYLFTKAQAIICTALGFRDQGAGPALAQMPYVTEQGVGAFLGLALFSLWLARTHLANTFRRAFLNDRSVDDSAEPLSYRSAYLGLLVSAVALIGFGVAIGLSPAVSVLFFALFFLLALTFTRIRAEAGLPWGQGPAGLVHGTLINFGGTEAFSSQETVSLTFLQWFDTDWRCLAQPAQLEAMKISDTTTPRRINPRQLTAALMVAVVIGTLAAWVSCLAIYYQYGAATANVNTWRTDMGRYPFEALQHNLTTPTPENGPRITAAIIGLAVTTTFSILRTRFLWWPFHPMGFAVGSTDTMTWIWFSVLLGWLAKSAILRFGGIRTYRYALPFFIGLVLGDYAVSGLWSLFFLATGHPGYRTFPI